MIEVFLMSILLMNYKRSKIITKQLENMKFKMLTSIYRNRYFFMKKFEQFSWNQNTPNYLFCFPGFPKVSSLHRFLLLFSPNTSHIQGTEQELNYCELNPGCIFSNYKLSRILFILIKSFQPFNMYIIIIYLTYSSVFYEDPERKQKMYRVYKNRKKGVCIV